jgi:hypothetical protein
MRWTPSLPAVSLKSNKDQTRQLKSVGLYKVQGEAVNAIVGATFQHFVRVSTFWRQFLTQRRLSRALPLLTECFTPEYYPTSFLVQMSRDCPERSTRKRAPYAIRWVAFMALSYSPDPPPSFSCHLFPKYNKAEKRRKRMSLTSLPISLPLR